MKVLQFNVTANWGSTGKIAEGIGLAAMQRGWDSSIVYGRYMNNSESQLLKTGRDLDVYTHYALHRFADGEGLGSKNATKNIIRKIKEVAPDIVHLHNIHDHWLNYPLLFDFLEQTDIPIVWTFHDCWAFTGHCPHFENIGCFKWKSKCNNCPSIPRFSIDRSARNFELKKRIFAKLSNRLTIVSVSNWLDEFVSESFLKNCRHEIIHNGVDTKVFCPDSQVSKERMIIGVSNVWPAYKGLNDFIMLRDLLPDDIKITLVGLTPKQIKSLPANIRGITRTSNVSELVNLYRRGAVFVNPTHNDTFPTVNLEALSCGTPVITYNTGGSPEAIDKSTGIVVPKGDVSALADAVKQVIARPFSAEDCRKRAETFFDKENQFDKYIDLYADLLK